MNYFEAQEFFKQMYPGKQITFEFDNNCVRQLEIIHTDGKPNPIHHVEYRKLKVTPEGQDSVYVPIMPHRMCVDWNGVKQHVNNLPDPISEKTQ